MQDKGLTPKRLLSKSLKMPMQKYYPFKHSAHTGELTDYLVDLYNV